MIPVQDVIRKAIELTEPEILKEPDRLIDLMEDLQPEDKESRTWIHRIYSDSLGNLLYQAYLTKADSQDQIWQSVRNYLDRKLSLKEEARDQAARIFISAFTGEKEPVLPPFQGKSSPRGRTAGEPSARATLEAARRAEAENIIQAVKLYNSIHDGSSYEVEARKRLGKIYEIYPEMAFRNYLRAAELEDIQACYKVGCMYENGEGTGKDYIKAADFYSMAGEKGGHMDALHRLADLYYNGNGVRKDYQKAFELYMRSAGKGNAESMRSLGRMYENGLSVSQDYHKAGEWYAKAADHGLKDALIDLHHIRTGRNQE